MYNGQISIRMLTNFASEKKTIFYKHFFLIKLFYIHRQISIWMQFNLLSEKRQTTDWRQQNQDTEDY